MKEAHEPIIAKELFEQVQEEVKYKSNIESVDGKTKRKGIYYSAKEVEMKKLRKWWRSETSAKELVDMGYINVYDCGGIIDWTYEVVKE